MYYKKYIPERKNKKRKKLWVLKKDGH
jgi:hypothetical protein